MTVAVPILLNQDCPVVAEEISRLMAAAYLAEAQLIGATDFPPLQTALSGLLSPDSLFVGIRNGDSLIAAAEIEDSSDGLIVIAALVVSPDYFRLGFGEMLLRYIVIHYRARSIRVSTASGNEPACALYSKVGFEKIASWQTSDGYRMVTLQCAPLDG